MQPEGLKLLESIYLPIRNNKFKWLFYIAIALFVSLIVTYTFGENYNGNERSDFKPKQRETRETSSGDLKDPFPSRPRIQTRNGHLMIEASADKNIEFKTSGARGSVVINGHKLDQLLDVTKALEKSSEHLSSSRKSDWSSLTASTGGDTYEMVLRNLFASEDRFSALEKSLDELNGKLVDLNKQVAKMSRKLARRFKQLNTFGKLQETLVAKLKRNDCFNPETGQPVCKNGATCLDSFDGFKCLCPANFEGPTCELDVDECAKFRGTDLGCQNGAKCVNLPGTYSCECPIQYHGVHCTEQHDDCSLSSSKSLCGYGKCVNLARNVANQAHYECICDQGWTTDGSNPACVIDINECLLGPLNGTSSDTSVAWNNALTAAYPCSQNPFVECTNLPGSFQCGPCPAGYSGGGRVCRDVDECQQNNGGCSLNPLVDCINTPGSRRCAACPPGYVGDGALCTRMGACQAELNGGCHERANCVELTGVAQGSRLCICQYPFAGSGVGLNGCSLHRPAPLPANGTIAAANECAPSPCANDARCKLTDSGFECICPIGWSGRVCDEQSPTQQACGAKFYVSEGSFKFPTGGSFANLLKPGADDQSKPASERHLNCLWSISVANNMSVSLAISEFANKLNPTKRVEMFLGNSTIGHQPAPVPLCAEFLDVRERFDSDASARLLARFCPEQQSSGKLTRLGEKQQVSLVSDSNWIELEYSFAATRTQFGEPSLAFALNWSQVAPPCGGELPAAEFGSISSPRFPEFYLPGIECRFLIRAPPGKRLRMQFGELNLLTSPSLHSSQCADSLTILDGSIGFDRPVLFKHCANNSTLMSKAHGGPTAPILSFGSTVELVLLSQQTSTTPLMKPKQQRGFYLTYSSESAPVGCGGLSTAKSAAIKSADYLPGIDEPRYALQLARYLESRPDSQLDDHSVGANRSRRWPVSGSYKTRCEYEIRPKNAAANHKISLDWLDLPDTNPTDSNALSYWSRRLRCAKSRLTIYDGNPLDSSNRTLLASFCSGDKYNASLPTLAPVVSSGHVLILIYEAAKQLPVSSLEDQPQNAGGFKLQYSTVCTATYRQLEASFQVDMDADIGECIYHIVLPANNTISLELTPQYDPSSLTDGSCSAQSFFVDGALDNMNNKLSLLGIQSQLKRIRFDSDASGVRDESPFSDEVSTPTYLRSNWYHSASRVHEIKEFETCQVAKINYDSIWNQFSLLFRLKPGTDPKKRLKLTINYSSLLSCGGIISEPREGSFELKSKSNLSSIESSETSMKRFKQKSDATKLKCSYVLRAPTSQQVQLTFQTSAQEINSRYSDWLLWSKKQKPDSDARFECEQVFLESIELYEPSLNRTRHLCPTELINTNVTRWSTQSNIVYIRLSNNTALNSSSKTNGTWPGRKALDKFNVVTKYKFFSTREKYTCGGRLLQDSGVISSPRFPFNYPPNSNCVWILQANPRQQIRLNITKFEIERQAYCLFDYLEIRNGPTSDSPLIGRFCNQDLQSKVIVSHSSFLWLNFKSDGILGLPGFEIYFDGAQTGCGGKLSASSGQIDSPNYPHAYAHSSDCEWTIELGQSNRIELTVEDLDLSSDSDSCSTNGTQLSDYLELFDSGGEFLSRSLGKFCSSKAMKKTKFLSTSNKLFIVYKSQALDNSRGFRLTYKTVCKPVDLIGFRGVIESPGFPSNYARLSSCGWTIRAPLGSNLSIAITDLSIDNSSTFISGNNYRSDCNEDFLEIWSVYLPLNATSSSQTIAPFVPPHVPLIPGKVQKGINSDKRLTRYFCGQLESLENERDRFVELDTNVAYIRFESDRSVEQRGFRLEWQSEGCGGLQVGDSIQMITYHERANQNRPTECLWSFDLSKVATTLEFQLSSDLRSPEGARAARQTDSCDEVSLTIYDGLTDKAPVLTRNCDAQKSRETVLTSGGQALVRFFSSGVHNYGRGFMLNGWASGRDGCLASVFEISTPFNQQSGSKKSPNYPDLYEANQYRCYGLLSAQSGRLQFRIEELDIPVDPNAVSTNLLDTDTCRNSGNYLVIKNLVGRSIEELFCGKIDQSQAKDVARSTVVLEQEASWLDFYTKGNSRGRWKLSYGRLCGSLVQISYPRDLTSPNYPARPNWVKSGAEDDANASENVCIWRLKTDYPRTSAKETEKKLHLNIVDFVESDNIKQSPTDCVRIFEGVDLSLRRSKFNLTEIDAKFQPKIKICKQSDIKHNTLYYISSGNELLVMITGNAIVKMRVKPFENFCGGEFHLNSAEFASLGYPQPYGSDLDCHYFIRGSPGSRIKLNFVRFDLPEGDNDEMSESSNNTNKCDNVDYVEIRQLSMRKKLQSHLNDILSSIAMSSKWSDIGFLVSNEQSSKKNVTGSGKSANSSSSKAIVSSSRSYERLYDLAKLYYLFYEPNSQMHRRIGSIGLDDFYEISTLLGRFCGKKAPTFTTRNLQDEILVRFRSHDAGAAASEGVSAKTRTKAARGFLAEYKIEYGGAIELSDPESLDGGFISSPSYPSKSRANATIRWTFETKLNFVLQFDLISLDLGSPHQDCQDSLSLFDGLNSETSIKLSQLCGHLSFKSLQYKRLSSLFGGSPAQAINVNLLPVYLAHDPRVKSNLIRSVRTSSNVASIVYDNFKSEGTFLLRYKALSKSSLINDISNGTAPPIDEDAPLDANEVIAQEQDSFEPSDGRNASKSCSRSYRLSSSSQNTSQVLITSPDWPLAPPKDVECHWLVYSQENNNVRLSVDPPDVSNSFTEEDSFNSYDRRPDFCLDPKHSGERRNFIAVHDGATRLSPIIGRHCLPAPPIQFQSTGRYLLVRYVHADRDPSSVETGKSELDNPAELKKSLFKARASLSDCGGQYHVLSSTRLRDRQNRNKQYDNNLNCKFYIFAANQDRVVVIHNEMSEFDLSSEPTNSDCSVGDYIEIRDLPVQTDLMDASGSTSGRSLGRFCAGRKLEYIESPGSAISIEFKTDSQNTSKGFELFVMSSIPHINCPRGYVSLNSDEPFGSFTSPNWPHGFFGKRHCKYQLAAAANQSILVTFVRLQRPLPTIEGEQDPVKKCADKFSYLADNEAASLRYDHRPLQELQSPVSGTLMRQLVKEVPCRNPTKARLSNAVADLQDIGEMSLLDTNGFKKISSDDYYALAQAAPQRAFTIKTESHILLLDYETRNLMPKQGFVAIYRLIDDKKYKCGGELTYRSGEKSVNLIESAKFGEETSQDEDYIQCDWSIKRPQDFSYTSILSTISYSATPSSKVAETKTAFIVFQVLEIAPQTGNGSLYEDEYGTGLVAKTNEVCGLNKMIISDIHYGELSPIFACGNLTGIRRWSLLEPAIMNKVSLRTKNLRVISSDGKSNKSAIYRGVRGYFYEKSCRQVERLVGEGVRFKSHNLYPNTSYSPGICKWELRLSGGDYELWFDSVQFRKPENFVEGSKSVACDVSNPYLDYLEIRASVEDASPVLARYCIYNQLVNKQKALLLNMKSQLTIMFVAGIKQLEAGLEQFNNASSGKQVFGWDATIVRIKNETLSEFCRRDSRQSIYWFVRNKGHDYYDNSMYLPSMSSFLYPKNTHCVLDFNLDEGMRYNFSFKGIFDFEQSKECQNDYIQIDDLLPANSTSAPTIEPINSAKKAKNQVLGVKKRAQTSKLIGRWCGRSRPIGYFESSSNKVLITFHSNERVEGKGFQLEYSVIQPNSTGSNVI